MDNSAEFPEITHSTDRPPSTAVLSSIRSDHDVNGTGSETGDVITFC